MAPTQPSSHDLGLPEGDDLLGLTAVSPGDASNLTSQAAALFRATKFFSPPEKAEPGPRCVHSSVGRLQWMLLEASHKPWTWQFC
jgi:hypothetical protein